MLNDYGSKIVSFASKFIVEVFLDSSWPSSLGKMIG